METKVFITNVSAFSDGELFRRLYEAMDPERKSKIDTCLFDKDKRLSLGVGALLAYAQGLFGPDIKFNLSHSGEFALCAVSDCEVGCDVEKYRDRVADIADRFFYRSEYDTIVSQKNSEEQERMFFRFWTLKESFMKVTKLGFKLPLNAFEIIMKDDTISVNQSVDKEKYTFFEYDEETGYACAVALRNYVGEKPELINIDLRDIRL